MNLKVHALSAALLTSVICAPASAQQDIPWKQTLNIPKGQNMPRGVSADILGIEAGDTFEEAKTKLEKLRAESVQKPVPAPQSNLPPQVQAMNNLRALEKQASREASGAAPGPGITEIRARFLLQAPGSSEVAAANFVSEARLERELKGTTSRNIKELLRVRFSAPSSGHQVLGIYRSVSYLAESDQPLVSELMAALAKKFGQEAQESSGTWLFQFHKGQPYSPPKPTLWRCREGWDVTSAQEVPKINFDGDCDVALRVKINKGISPNHAKDVIFTLSDNERAKANLGADFAYFRSYVEGMRATTRGTQPKL